MIQPLNEVVALRVGVIICVLGLPLIGVWQVKTDPKRQPDYIKAEAVDCEARSQWREPSIWGGKDRNGMIKMVGLRDRLLKSLDKTSSDYFYFVDVNTVPAPELNWVLMSLTNRPEEYRYDVRCIRLIGVIKDVLSTRCEEHLKIKFDKRPQCGKVLICKNN